MMMSAGDIRQLAGLWEGEGTFYFREGSPHMSIGVTDRDVIDTARRWMSHDRYITRLGKLASVTTRRKGRYAPIHQFTLSGQFAASWMMTLYMLMGQRRKAQIRVALNGWRRAQVAYYKRTHCPRGHPHVLHWKQSGKCRECNLVRCRDYYQKHRERLVIAARTSRMIRRVAASA